MKNILKRFTSNIKLYKIYKNDQTENGTSYQCGRPGFISNGCLAVNFTIFFVLLKVREL